MLDIVKQQLKDTESVKDSENDSQTFKWSEKTEDERKTALKEAEIKYDTNIAQTDLKIDIAVQMGLITEKEALELIKVQENYLKGLYFSEMANKKSILEEKLFGLPIDQIEASDEFKGLLSFIRQKTYYCGLMCKKMDNIKLVDILKEERLHNDRRKKIREKTPELDDYLETQPDTTKKETTTKRKGRKKRGK